MTDVLPIQPSERARLFTAAAFFNPAECRRIRRAMDAGVPEPAEILTTGIERQDDVRRASNIEIDTDVLALVEARLDGVRDRIAGFFERPLGRREGASVLRYQDGGFYRPHRDRGMVPGWPGAAHRSVAVVVFLNSSRAADPDGEFSGGALQLYVDDDPLDLDPRQGLLVAFPAAVLHQVLPVAGGIRDTIVDWFY